MHKAVEFDRSAYPNTAAVADMFDMNAGEQPVFSDDEDKQYEIVGYEYQIADAGDRSVGIPPGQATPAFKSWRELEDFCTEHLKTYENLADSDTIPQKWFWEDQAV